MDLIICYICGNLTTNFTSIQDGRSQYSGKLFRELIESISGSSVDLPDVICNTCVTKLNEFDEFTLKAEQIQCELKMLMYHKIYVKQEPQEEPDNLSIGSYDTEINTDNEEMKCPTEKKIQSPKAQNMSAVFDWNSIEDIDDKKLNKLKSKKSLKKRIKSGDVFPCTFESCDRRFATKNRLLHHIQLHSKERPFQCSFCGKFYKTRDCLRSHQRVVHKNADLRVICDTCGLAFTRKPSLERHYKAAHLKLRTFVCQLCGASYCNASSLHAHSFVHDKDNKNFVCQICEARFHTRSKLTRHMRCHGEKEFECLICHRKYSQRYNLTAHMKQAHEQFHIQRQEQALPIVCQLCGRVFDRQKALNKHLKSVHEAVPISASLD